MIIIEFNVHESGAFLTEICGCRSGKEGSKWIGFPIITPFFQNELRSLNRSKMTGAEDRSAPERPLVTGLDICIIIYFVSSTMLLKLTILGDARIMILIWGFSALP